MSSKSLLLVSRSDGIGVITLNRPEKLNAVNLEMRLAFHRVLDEFCLDEEVCVVVVTGTGQAFCVGADIAEFIKGAPGGEQGKPGVMDTVKKLVSCKKPIIGAINGVASGDGAQWVLAFDLNVASEGATFSWPATRLGLL